MLDRIQALWRSPGLSSFDSSVTRERLIQSGRIAFVDDENPLLIEELRSAGFAVDHDKEARDLRNYDSQIYDVAIVDYHGVAQHLGAAQGLDLVKHIRRVSPRTRVIAYTSRSLSAAESEFFRLSHAVLPKDFGLGDSLALVETELRKAFAKQHLLDALLEKLAISDGAEKRKIEEALVKALGKRSEGQFKEYVSKAVGSAASKSVELIVSKLF